MKKLGYLLPLIIFFTILSYGHAANAGWFDFLKQPFYKTTDERAGSTIRSLSQWNASTSPSAIFPRTESQDVGLWLMGSTQCLQVDANGIISGTGSACGAGGGEANTASSLGTGLNLFDTKSGVDLRFNTISAGSNITISTTTQDNTLEISSTGGGLHVDGGGFVYPQTGDYHSAPYYTATSTSATSTFPSINVATSADIFSVYGESWSDFCVSITGSADLCDGSDDGAGGSGEANTVSTSTTPTVGHLAYWTTSGAFPELLNSTATTTLTVSSPLSLSNPISVIGASASDITLDTSGTWTGNAGTATALAANGGNCTSGNAPLGVDASGAVEDCFDVWTEAENTAAAYLQNITGESIFDLSDTASAFSTNSLLYWNGTSLTSTSSDSLYVGSITATTTNTNFLSQSDIDNLVNLTSNGFVKTSGGDGTLSVDTSTYLTANQTITLSGDVTGSGETAITTTIATNAVDPGMLADSDFGDFTCTTGDCVLDLGVVDSTAILDSTILAYDLSTTTAFADNDLISFDSASGGFTGLTCAEITGSADLCDGSDDGAGGGAEHVDDGLFVYPGDGDYHSAPYYSATSTTATSTFLGSVGVGTSTTAYDLDVYGSARFDDGVSASSTIQNRDDDNDGWSCMWTLNGKIYISDAACD